MPAAPDEPRHLPMIPSPSAPLARPERAGPVLTPERSVERDFDRDALRRLLPPFKVVVHNNDVNTFDEVIKILMRAVPGMTHERATQLANEIHTSGAAVPYVGPKERAEAVAAVIRTIGIKVTIEPDS